MNRRITLKSGTLVEHKVIELNKNVDSSLVIYSVLHISKRYGFNSTDGTLLATAASELVTNIIRYASEGEFTINVYKSLNDHFTGIELIAMDKGPGIADVNQALEERFSSQKNSLGLGLPSVKRIMDEFKIISETGKGTCVTSSMWRKHEES